MRADARLSRALSRRRFDCSRFQRADTALDVRIRLSVFIFDAHGISRTRLAMEMGHAVDAAWIFGDTNNVRRTAKPAVLPV